MKSSIFFIALIACVVCASKKTSKELDPNVKREVRAKIIECVSSNGEISQVLKNHLEEVKKSDVRIPLHFSKVELTEKDREIIKECKRSVFKEKRKNEEPLTTL